MLHDTTKPETQRHGTIVHQVVNDIYVRQLGILTKIARYHFTFDSATWTLIDFLSCCSCKAARLQSYGARVKLSARGIGNQTKVAIGQQVNNNCILRCLFRQCHLMSHCNLNTSRASACATQSIYIESH